MMDGFQILNTRSNEQALEIAKILIKAARETHAVVIKSEAQSKKARYGIATHDKETMWKILQEYINQYAGFINNASAFTGIGLLKVNQDFYERVATDDIENQLQIIIGFIYAKEASDSVAKETYQQRVKKLLKKSKVIDDEWKQLLI